MTTKTSHLQRTMAGITAASLIVAQLTFPPRAEAASLGSSTASAGSAPPPSTAAIQSFQPDLFTGRATTSIPIVVPPGRKGLQPSLALAYSSSGRNGWVGVGWSLDLGYIERSTKDGVPKYGSSDAYAVAFQGITSDLVQILGGTYRTKDEGGFVRFTNQGVSGWEARDKSGTRYLFGQTAASQIESLGRVARWSLDKIIDANGNSLTLTYEKDQNQLYLKQIDYTGHESGSAAPANRVVFTNAPRADVETSYRPGFSVTTAKRLESIEASALVNGAWSLARRYQFGYAASKRTGRSLLASVTQVGTDGATSLPPATFAYQDATAPTYALAGNNPSISTAAWNLSKAGSDRSGSNYGCVRPYDGLPWQSPVIADPSHPVDLGCYNATVGSDGNLTVNGCRDHYMHAWTWVYVGNARPVSLSYTGGEACMYLEDGSRLHPIGSSFTLPAGWSIVHLTGYDETQGWTNTLTGSLKNQVDLMSPSQFIRPQLTGDVDGNGTSDLVTFDQSTGTWKVARAQPSGFSPDETWLTGFGNASSLPLLGDFDGDGLTDLMLFSGGSWRFARSTSSSFVADVWPSIPFGSGTPFAGDFNGDGRIDLGTFDNGSWRVALNTGSGFSSAGSFSPSWGASSDEPMTGDFNGDGLTDVALINKSTGTIEVRLSTGADFAAPAAWLSSPFGPGQPHNSADINGDGLTDVAYYDKAAGQVRYLPSAGTRFDDAQGVQTLPPAFSLRSADDQLQIGDFNGDGLSDPAVFNPYTGRSEVASSSGTFSDLLSELRNGLGGRTSLAYQRSSQLVNSFLPFVIPVVQQVAVSDGMEHSYATTYSYSGGLYDAPTKEFRGFARAEVRDADANVTVTEFHQDLHKKGRPFRTQFIDARGALWTKTEQTWSCTEPYPGVHFVTLDQTDGLTYGGDATFKQTRSRFTYDSSGNIARVDEDGEVGIIGDERSTVTSYALNQTDWILNKPGLVQTLDAQGNIVAQRRFYYDGAAITTAVPTTGNLTKEEEWLNLPAEQWLATTLRYDTYGNVAAVTDALGRTTTNTYDATGTYLTQIQNALGHTRNLVYDPRLGQVTGSIDQNGVETRTAYDALGRVTQTGFIDPTTHTEVVTTQTAYDLTTIPTRTTVRARLTSGAADELTSYTFTDGLGRAIQTRSPAKDSTKQIVSGAVELNNRGLAIKQWVPYLSATSSSYVAFSLEPSASSLAVVSYTYDPLGRLLTATDPDGSVSSTAYDDWSVTSTDANGHQTRRTQDAYGRLIAVEEFNSGQTHTTAYQYDTLNNLIQVTDAKGNITRISYDSLGRKLSMDDPDMGHWTYVYDAVDNLTGQTDARGIVISFTYDPLNRMTRKDYAIPPASSIQPLASVLYTYDGANDTTKPFTKGKLTKIADGSGSTTFEYDHLGRLIKESKTIDGATYAIQRQYDLLGRLISLTYPDNEVASYTYNPQGGIETIDLTSATLPPSHLVTDVAYNTAGQLIKITYGNGVITDYSYDPQTLRLSHLATQSLSHGVLQDFSYTFDPVGNVTEIRDAVHTGSQTFQYDDLNRLTQATGSYGAYTYAYDPLGNMTEKEGATMTYGLADGSKPHAVTVVSNPQVPASSLQLSYDANGNLVSKGPATEPLSHLATQWFSYDAENRLVQVDTAQEETVSVIFKPGWNFFSLPVIPDDASIATLFPAFSVDFEQLARFVPSHLATEPLGHFDHYVGNPKFDDFSELEYGVGYQVYCKSPTDVTVTFRGKLPTKPLSKSVSAGWNLLPALSLTAQAVSTAFSGISYTDVRAYTPTTGSLTSTTQVNTGQAYWVNVSAPSTWTPPLPKNVTTSYVYDGDGGKVKQVTGSGTTTYLGEVYEKDPTAKTTKYVFAGNQRIAAKASDGELLFYHPDHLGSSDVVTNATGAVVEHTEHLPYGAVARHDSATLPPGHFATSFGFTGQRQDATHGLILFPARAYDPQLGRFLQPDPFVQDPGDPQTLNRYSYVRNNPINLVDPSGYGFRRFFRALFAAVAAVAATILTGGQAEVGAMVFVAIAGTAGAVVGDQVGRAVDRSLARLPTPSTSAVSNLVYNPAAGIGVIAETGSAVQPGQVLPLSGEQLTPEQETLQDTWSPFDFIGPGEIFGAGESLLYGLGRLGTGGFLRIGAEEAGSTVLKAGSRFSRFMSRAEVEAVEETGFLRGGRAGKTYFTRNKFSTVESAQSKLSLKHPPEMRLDFKLKNDLRVNGPTAVPRKYRQPGGGDQFWTSKPVEVDIMRKRSLR